jgi:FMN phosphatase YigB (HAD superfamily)
MASEAAGGIKAVVFDMGDVLGPGNDKTCLTRRLPPGADAAKAEQLFKNFFEDCKCRLGAPSEEDWRPILAELGINHSEWKAIDDDVKTCYHPYFQMFGLVDRLRRAGYRVGIISNHVRPWFDSWFQQYRLDQLFVEPRLVLVSADVGVAKPNIEIWRLFQERTGESGDILRPEEMVFVDDKQRNVDAARSLGWHSICFKYNKAAKPGDQAVGTTESVDGLTQALREKGLRV